MSKDNFIVFLSQCNFCKVRCSLQFTPMHIWPQGTLLSFHLFFLFSPKKMSHLQVLWLHATWLFFCFCYPSFYNGWTLFEWSIHLCNILQHTSSYDYKLWLLFQNCLVSCQIAHTSAIAIMASNATKLTGIYKIRLQFLNIWIYVCIPNLNV